MGWYDYFYDCWQNGTVTQEELGIAVQKGWITQEEYEDIVGAE